MQRLTLSVTHSCCLMCCYGVSVHAACHLSEERQIHYRCRVINGEKQSSESLGNATDTETSQSLNVHPQDVFPAQPWSPKSP